MSLPVTLAFSLLALVVSLPSGHAADWPAYRGPNRDGTLAGGLDLLEEPEQIWKVNVGGGRRCAVSVAGGLAFTNGADPDHNTNVTCLDATTGEKKWSYTTNWTESTPSVVGDRVYQMDNERFVYCLEVATGDLVWKSEQLPASTRKREWGHSGSTLVVDELVIVNISGGCALDRKTGKVVWQHSGFSGQATPVSFQRGGKAAVAIFFGDQLVARELKTGKQLWTIPWKTNHGVNAADPLFFDGDKRVLICSSYGLGRASYDVSGAAPRELWNFAEGNDGGAQAVNSPVLHRDQLLVFTGFGLGKVNHDSGAFIHGWGVHADAALSFDDHVLITRKSGEMKVLKSSGGADGPTFEQVSAAQICSKEMWNIPAYADGHLYVRNNKGDVFCWKIAK